MMGSFSLPIRSVIGGLEPSSSCRGRLFVGAAPHCVVLCGLVLGHATGRNRLGGRRTMGSDRVAAATHFDRLGSEEVA